jgi:hypothetical protein
MFFHKINSCGTATGILLALLSPSIFSRVTSESLFIDSKKSNDSENNENLLQTETIILHLYTKI